MNKKKFYGVHRLRCQSTNILSYSDCASFINLNYARSITNNQIVSTTEEMHTRCLYVSAARTFIHKHILTPNTLNTCRWATRALSSPSALIANQSLHSESSACVTVASMQTLTAISRHTDMLVHRFGAAPHPNIRPMVYSPLGAGGLT
jgi:hypothetical protein